MKKYVIPIIILTISIILSIYFYPLLPESVASHWNANGQVDGYSSKLTSVIMFPALQLFMLVLLVFIPRIDPKRENIKTFEKEFLLFINSMLIFFTLIQLQTFLWSTGTQIPMNSTMAVLMGALFLVMAYLIKNAKQNYTIGIRTPWTLNSEKVWNKTHALGYKLFGISGILSILSAFVPQYSYIIVLASVLTSSAYVFLYSYLEYKKELHNK